MFDYLVMDGFFHCNVYLKIPSFGGAWGGLHFPIRYSSPHVVVPFFLREVALHVLMQVLGNLRQ